ncbi:MAG: hypothetical protein EXS36_19650 [Pedosphaera sp.]|nr:hypothetical protein [Pedosphaera sp.]
MVLSSLRYPGLWAYRLGDGIQLRSREDNALHSFGHRFEGILSLTVGRGLWSGPAGDTNAWNRFTWQADKYPDDAQVGNVHDGPNATSGYDYGQAHKVMSGAEMIADQRIRLFLPYEIYFVALNWSRRPSA